MGGENTSINMSNKPPTVVMMVGLQGAGKTTTADIKTHRLWVCDAASVRT